MSRFLLSKNSQTLLNSRRWHTKGNPRKGVSFPGVNRGLKGEWNGNIPCCFEIYILLQCRMSSTFSWSTI